MIKKIFCRFHIYFVLIFLYTPILVIILFAFNESKSRTTFSKISLKWFLNLFKNKIVLEAFFNSLIIATLASIVSIFIGLIFALQISKLKIKTQNFFLNLNYFPIINSDVTIGISLMIILQLILNLIKQNMGFVTVLTAHIVICVPYVIFNLVPRLNHLNLNQLNAALDLGCTPTVAFYKVFLPQMMTELLSSFMIAFSISFDDFTITYFTAGTSFQTLPLLIYSMVRKRITPTINALFFIILTLAFVVIVTFNTINLKTQKNEKLKGQKSLL